MTLRVTKVKNITYCFFLQQNGLQNAAPLLYYALKIIIFVNYSSWFPLKRAFYKFWKSSFSYRKSYKYYLMRSAKRTLSRSKKRIKYCKFYEMI